MMHGRSFLIAVMVGFFIIANCTVDVRGQLSTAGSTLQRIADLEKAVSGLEKTLLTKTDSTTNDAILEQLKQTLANAVAEINQINASIKKIVGNLDKAVDEIVKLQSANGTLESKLSSIASQQTAFVSQHTKLLQVLAKQSQVSTKLENRLNKVENKQVIYKDEMENMGKLISATANHNFQNSAELNRIDVELKKYASRCRDELGNFNNQLNITNDKLANVAASQNSNRASVASCATSLAAINDKVVNVAGMQQFLMKDTLSNQRNIITARVKVTELSASVSKLNALGGRNIRQFVWNEYLQQDSGVLKTFAFKKNAPGTALRLSFQGTLFVNVPNRKAQCCSRWYFTVNGQECAAPAKLENVLSKAGSSVNYLLPATVSGICQATALGPFSGSVRIQLLLGRCGSPMNDLCDAWTGSELKSTQRVEVEEISIGV